MPFDQGSVTFRVCHLPNPLPDDVLERFAAKSGTGLDSVRDEPMLGWVARHLLETRIDEDTAYRGGFLTLTLRHAERRIPASLLRAECQLLEIAAMAAKKTDRLPRKERKEIKQEVTDRLLPTMPVQLSGTSFVVDASDGKLYVGCSSDKQMDVFLAMFQETVGFEPIPLPPDIAANDLFGINPDTVPPVNISPALSDANAGGTLGQNFLTWLWHFQEANEGRLPKSQLGEFGILVDGPLTFVAEGPGAHESTLRKGLPTLSAEAKASLEVGKKLSRAKLVVARGNETWGGTLDADTFTIRSLKLPEGEALDPASAFEERMTHVYTYQTLVYNLFGLFLREMTDDEKRSQFANSAKKWVAAMDGK